MSGSAILTLGSNVAGSWGSPDCSLRRAVERLSEAGLTVAAVSSLYKTPPLGRIRQPWFLNAALVVQTDQLPRQLVNLAKQTEHEAGRRRGAVWGPRPLDIDLIDYRGWRIGQESPAGRRPPLVLPHPEAARRGFVLVPIEEIAPHWRHPVLGLTASELLARTPLLRRGLVRLLDSNWLICDKEV